MSNEISYSFNLLLKNGSLNDQFASTSKAANQTVAGLVRNVQTIAIFPTTINLGSVNVPGWSVFQNLDATNFVTIGTIVMGTVIATLKLKPGELVMCRLGMAIPVAVANLAPISLFYIIYED